MIYRIWKQISPCISIRPANSSHISSTCWLYLLLYFQLLDGPWRIIPQVMTTTTISQQNHRSFSSLHLCSHILISLSTPRRHPRPSAASPPFLQWLRSLTTMLVSVTAERRSTTCTLHCVHLFPQIKRYETMNEFLSYMYPLSRYCTLC